MSNQFHNCSNFMLSVKVLLFSTGVLSLAMALKLSVPVISDFAVSEVPVVWSVLVSWLKPPYLYLVINCIIITIVASSKLQSSKVEDSSLPEKPVQIQQVPVVSGGYVRTEYDLAYNGHELRSEVVEPVIRPEVFDYGFDAKDAKAPELIVYAHEDANVPKTKKIITVDASEKMNGSGEEVLNRDPPEYAFPAEKPSISSRFGQRKSVKASPEGGKTLGVSKPKRHDTLESTWKTITEGRSMPLTRHLRKSDTWETHGRHHHHHHHGNANPDPRMTKSETFNDRVAVAGAVAVSNNSSLSPSPGSGKLRKEPSLSQDDLNRRVEAFIKKFNDDMRLQRQESLNQYMEMINRGAH